MKLTGLADVFKVYLPKHIQYAKHGQIQPSCYMREVQHRLQSYLWKVITINFTEETNVKWNAAERPAAHQPPTLSSSSTLCAFLSSSLIRTCFLWAQRGSSSRGGSVQVWACMQITTIHCFSASSPPWDSCWIETYHLFGESLSVLTNWAAQPHSKFIKALFLRITHKAYLRADSQGKNYTLIFLVHTAQKQPHHTAALQLLFRF